MIEIIWTVSMFVFLEVSSTSIPKSQIQANYAGVCGGLPKLSVLPGCGWDNLRNMDMSQVMAITYDNCGTTPDGKYLVPDNSFVIPVGQSDVEQFSEVIDSWSNYSSVTSKSFNTNSGLTMKNFGISGSYSSDYQSAKKRQVNEKSTTFRIHARYAMYATGTNPTGKLDSELQKRFDEAVTELKFNNTEKVDYILETIVRDYGTHMITRMDAGAIVMQEDYVSRQFVQDFKGDKKELKEAASASFFKTFQFGQDFAKTTNQTTIKQYTTSITSSHVTTIGGGLFKPGSPVAEWVDTIPDHVTGIDRMGVPLHFVITPSTFPTIDLQLLSELQTHFYNAIMQYYSYNEHRGCTTIGSPNFDFTANVDDNSCEDSAGQYAFGGVFQTCSGELCDGSLTQKNPLTGGYNCPKEYKSTLLRNGKFIKYKCREHCTGHRPRRRCEKICDVPVTQVYTASWCAAVGNVSPQQVVMFGGVYTPDIANPVTKDKSCPTPYMDLVILQKLHICVGTDNERGLKYSTEFGGFFSCQYGNPFYGSNSSQTDGPYTAACPTGYTQNAAIIDQDCLVNYCVRAGSYSKDQEAPIVLPPFQNERSLFLKHT